MLQYGYILHLFEIVGTCQHSCYICMESILRASIRKDFKRDQDHGCSVMLIVFLRLARVHWHGCLSDQVGALLHLT